MRVGFSLPQFGPQTAHADKVAAYAREVEAAGAASLWVSERLIAATEPEVGYQGGPDIPAEFNARLDPFALLTVAATATSTVALGSNVLILPWYPPAFLARMLGTIDALSGGRLLPGYGIGWSPEEYRAMGVPMAARGARLDEALDGLAAFGADPAEYHGRYVEVPRTHNGFARRLPVYLSAFSPAALDRVGARADGWLPSMQVGRPGQGEVFRGMRERIDAAARAAGRDPAAIDSVLRVNARDTTDLGEIVAAIGEVTEATGIDHVLVDTTIYLSTNPDEALELNREVLTRLR